MASLIRSSYSSPRLRPPDARPRRGSVLVMVMAILGILFVTGITFMATMNFEAERVAKARQRIRTEPKVRAVATELKDVFRDTVVPSAGSEIDMAGSLVGGSPADFADVPGVHSLASPIEPYHQASAAMGIDRTIFPWFTDLRALRQRPFEGTKYKGFSADMDTKWVSGLAPTDPNWTDGDELVPVDADGDGVVDTVQFDLADLDIDPDVRRELAAVVNPPSRKDGSVFLGMRVIPHGGMVNVNESHSTLLINILGNPDGTIPTHDPPYDPLVEEDSLRRRFMLPPRVLPPTKLQGNPVDADPDTGGGDFAQRLFPPGQSLRDHRYWPYGVRPEPEIDKAVDPDRPLWAVRLDPLRASAVNPGEDFYDRRHLVTTVSYDDLMARDTVGAIVDSTIVDRSVDNATYVSIVDRMIEINTRFYQAAGTCDRGITGTPPFPYVEYPNDVPNTYTGPVASFDRFNWCECVANPDVCTLNPRKGHLRLSLAWLDDAVDNGTITPKERIAIIRDAFTLMLLNARGEEWGSWQPAGIDSDNDANRDHNAWIPDFDKVSLTAASLTANLLDFVDQDDIPTRVEVRQSNYTLPDPPAGDPFGKSYNPPRFVYGLERQPFITEVAAQVGGAAVPPAPAPPSSYAVELFNPYDFSAGFGAGNDIPAAQYLLETEGGRTQLNVDRVIPGGEFTVFKTDNAAVWTAGRTLGGEIIDLDLGSVPLEFSPGSTIRLLRRVTYNDPDFGAFTADIVVDEFKIPADSNLASLDAPSTEVTYSIERPGVTARPGRDSSPWLAPIPTDSQAFLGHSLGKDNISVDTLRRPVEIQLANVTSNHFRDALPTTGSMLLIMRYANEEFGFGTNEPFTAKLDEEKDLAGFLTLDNGRMPIFDESGKNHIEPAVDPTVNPPLDSRVPPPTPPPPRPGDIVNLPWGQLVFDYFTALPLSNGGPFSTAPGNNPNMPRVESDGMRVHGRININAAPWKVMAGLPLMPTSAFINWPSALRNKIEAFAILDISEAAPIGSALAKSIASYRELRIDDAAAFDQSNITPATGDFARGRQSDGLGGRGWQQANPTWRRGTGFLSIGELANIRHPDAEWQPVPGSAPPQLITDYAYNQMSFYRIDGGMLGSSFNRGGWRNRPEDYIGAVAVLVSLGDWMSVRSEVFTTYGVIRGVEDTTILDADQAKQTQLRLEDINARAIRFQETFDRTPMLLGERKAEPIGRRVIARYNDTWND